MHTDLLYRGGCFPLLRQLALKVLNRPQQQLSRALHTRRLSALAAPPLVRQLQSAHHRLQRRFHRLGSSHAGLYRRRCRLQGGQRRRKVASLLPALLPTIRAWCLSVCHAERTLGQAGEGAA